MELKIHSQLKEVTIYSMNLGDIPELNRIIQSLDPHNWRDWKIISNVKYQPYYNPQPYNPNPPLDWTITCSEDTARVDETEDK